MSCCCYFQEISPQIFNKFQIHPSVVDIFREAYELKKYSDNYWKGIEKLEEEWQDIDSDLGTQQRITREIYERIESEIPDIISAASGKACCVGGYDAFDWLEDEGLIGVEIGNQDYYGYLTYLNPQQVQTMTEKLQQFRRQHFMDVYKILYPQSVEIQETREDETDFWIDFYEIFHFCQKITQKSYGLLLYCG